MIRNDFIRAQNTKIREDMDSLAHAVLSTRRNHEEYLVAFGRYQQLKSLLDANEVVLKGEEVDTDQEELTEPETVKPRKHKPRSWGG